MTEEPIEVVKAGKKLKCGHCGWTHFNSHSALLNTTLLTFFKLDWLNRSAEIFICTACGHIEWFLDLPTTTR